MFIVMGRVYDFIIRFSFYSHPTHTQLGVSRKVLMPYLLDINYINRIHIIITFYCFGVSALINNLLTSKIRNCKIMHEEAYKLGTYFSCVLKTKYKYK